MKNPNGYGSVYKLPGKRRKPWTARVPSHYTQEGVLKRKYLGYFKSKKEAQEALIQFNKSGVSIENFEITFEEVYKMWSEDKFEDIAKTNSLMYGYAFEYSNIIHKMNFKDIRSMHLEKCINTCPVGYATKRKMKTLYNQLYKFVIKNSLADVKDYAALIDMPDNLDEENKKVPFTDQEIKVLWNTVNTEYVDSILILIYSGWRIGELLSIKISDVKLENDIPYFVGGSKTKAGKNRIVPIHSKILPLIENLCKTNNNYLIENAFGKQMKYSNYRREKWDNIMNNLNMDHRPHEARHTTATLLDRFGANKNAIKKILGHTGDNITEKVYIHKNLTLLKEAIETIKI